MMMMTGKAFDEEHREHTFVRYAMTSTATHYPG